jgi:hypothetical protein
MNGREHSLWSLEIGEGRVVTHRRGGAERFSAAGVRRVQSHRGASRTRRIDAEGFNGLVARSPSRRTVLARQRRESARAGGARVARDPRGRRAPFV